MEDSQTFKKISVKSNIVGTYTAEFVNEVDSYLGKLIDDDKNVLIIDKKVFELYTDLFHFFPNFKKLDICSAAITAQLISASFVLAPR